LKKKDALGLRKKKVVYAIGMERRERGPQKNLRQRETRNKSFCTRKNSRDPRRTGKEYFGEKKIPPSGLERGRTLI